MKATTDDRRIWIECAILAGLSALLAVIMNRLFARQKPGEPLSKPPSGDTLAAPGGKPTPEEKAKAEPVRRALEQATAQVDSPEKASRVAERLEELAGSTTTGEVEQADQSGKPATISARVAESSRRIEQATSSAPPVEKAAHGIAQAGKEITASSGSEQAALAEATQETLNPDQQGLPGDVHPKQREYMRQAVLKRMKPLDALDAELFLAVNHLPHNRLLNGFFRFFTLTFSAGLGWYVLMTRAILVDHPKGIRALRHTILPLSVASILVEYPIKAFFRRSRPFIDLFKPSSLARSQVPGPFPQGTLLHLSPAPGCSHAITLASVHSFSC